MTRTSRLGTLVLVLCVMLAAELAALRATDERCRRFLAAELDRAATMGAVVRQSAGRTDVAAHAAALEDAATWLRDAMTAGAP